MSWMASLALLAAVLGGCRSEQKPPPTTERATEPPAVSAPTPREAVPDELVWASIDPQTLDPARIHDLSAWWVSVNLFEGLLVPPAGDGVPVPGAAELPTRSADGLTYTFHLRPDAQWSDGRPVVAEDFVYAWRRAVDPATASPNADDFRGIEGALPIIEGKEPNTARLGVAAPDEHTLVVHLVQPIPYFEASVASPPFYPVRRDVVEAHGAQWTRPEHFVGNGAFVLKEWKHRDRLVLERNPRYWDAANVKLERAVMLHSENEDAALQWYQTGRIHWCNTLPPDKVVQLRKEGHPELHHGPMLCQVGAVFRVDRPPFDNLKVRRAFAMAVDRDRLVKHVLMRGDEAATHFIPSLFRKLSGYESPEGADYDPERARALLAEAGYPGGAGLPRVTYLYNTYDMNRTIGEFLQRSLKENLGVEVELENVEWKTYLARVSAGDFQLARSSYCGLTDPSLWLETFRTGGGSNYGRYGDPAFDTLLDRIAQEVDSGKRATLIAEAERVINDAQAVLPLYFPVRYYLLKPFVKGFEPQVMDVHLLKYVQLGS